MSKSWQPYAQHILDAIKHLQPFEESIRAILVDAGEPD